MSHKVDVDNVNETEQAYIDAVRKAKLELKQAEQEYSEKLSEACQVMHYRKVAHHTRQSDGAIRMQLRRILQGKIGRPR